MFSFLAYFERPLILLLAIPLILILFFFMRKDFMKSYFDESNKSRKAKLRIFVFIMRSLIFILLLISLASPFLEDRETVKGDPEIKILIDNSTSMQLLDTSIVDELVSSLEDRIPTKTSYIAVGNESRLGDGILSSVNPGDNVLLISDGNNNAGVTLGDVILQANDLNISISAINLSSKYPDSSVSIHGTSKTGSKVQNNFVVVIRQSENKPVHLVVEIDGSKIFDKVTDEKRVIITRAFESGYHKVSAKILDKDYNEANNIFYKSVKVVPKPKALVVGKSGNLYSLYDPIYELTKVEDLSIDLAPYTAVIINDVNAEKLNSYSDKLSSFISEGNGMFVVGGINSYDAGGYKGSRFEQLLPVTVAKAGKKQGDVSVVLVIDISGSTGESFKGFTKVDIEKALALKMITSISLVHKLGVIAFNTKAYEVAPLKKLTEQKDLENKISRLQFFGGTDMIQGLNAALAMLQDKGGSRNIIILSDGITGNKNIVKKSAQYAASQGIKVYTVGVGGTDSKFMKELAEAGNGVYFQPDLVENIKLIFGDTEINAGKRVFSLVTIDENHFITSGLDLDGNVYGFNQIVPKSSAKMLITTDTGDPLLVVGRFGLGRVASFGSDFDNYGVELLNSKNSLLATRIGNWVVGDPERKNPEFVDIADGRVNNYVDIIVKSKIQPTSEKVGLFRFDENLYRGTLLVNNTGFNQLFGATFAVNYLEEYEEIGFSEEFSNFIYDTNGNVFNPSEIENIVEFIKQKSTRDIVIRKSYSWIFLLISLILYLIEVCIRRLVNYKVV